VSNVRRTRVSLLTVLAALLVTLTVLAPPGASAAEPTRLAFVRGNQIYTSTLTGADVHQLTSGAKNYRPHWSPDGARIAFVHEASAGVRDIWVMDADGTHKHQVTHLGDTTEPTWSPDGEWIAFGANGTPPFGGYGRTLQRIRSTAPYGDPVPMPGNDETGDPAVVGTLAWSPDGTRIAYYSDSFPSSPDNYLLVYTVATGAIDYLWGVGGSCCGLGSFSSPTWTPDSSAIAFSAQTHDFGQPAPAGSHLRVSDPVAHADLPFATAVGDGDPDYSPGGTQLVFTHWSSVYRAHADGSHRVRVTRGYQPDWRPASVG
jgi:Tol biopolymer transport system component